MFNVANDFLHLDAEEIAKQLTLRDFEIFQSIHPMEFISNFWDKKNVCLSNRYVNRWIYMIAGCHTLCAPPSLHHSIQ